MSRPSRAPRSSSTKTTGRWVADRGSPPAAARPWGHPTADFLPEHQALPDETRERLGREFDARFAEVTARGELVHAQALGAPTDARLFRWRDDAQVASDGPYAETTEHLAGFFVVDVESRERAEEIARVFAGPGETIALRPTMHVE